MNIEYKYSAYWIEIQYRNGNPFIKEKLVSKDFEILFFEESKNWEGFLGKRRHMDDLTVVFKYENSYYVDIEAFFLNGLRG